MSRVDREHGGEQVSCIRLSNPCTKQPSRMHIRRGSGTLRSHSSAHLSPPSHPPSPLHHSRIPHPLPPPEGTTPSEPPTFDEKRKKQRSRTSRTTHTQPPSTYPHRLIPPKKIRAARSSGARGPIVFHIHIPRRSASPSRISTPYPHRIPHHIAITVPTPPPHKHNPAPPPHPPPLDPSAPAPPAAGRTSPLLAIRSIRVGG